jgi:ribosomal protein S27AE
MKLFGYEIMPEKEFSEIQKSKKKLEASYEKVYSERPNLDQLYSYTHNAIQNPTYPLSIFTIYQFSLYSSTFSTIIRSLQREIFKNGISVQPSFHFKCEQCGEEYAKDQDGKCNNCGSAMRKPAAEQEDVLIRWLKGVNDNDQSMMDVMLEVEKDLESVDDCYLVAVKEYIIDQATQKIVDWNVLEVVRGDPLVMKILSDKSGRAARDESGNQIYFCPKHNGVLFKSPLCPKCGMEAIRAYYKAETHDKRTIFYGRDDVCHASKYHPSPTYGVPLFFSVWMKVAVLINMDKYIQDWYFKQRPTKGLLSINTGNDEAIRKGWEMASMAIQKNPHAIFPFITGDSNAKFDWIDFGLTIDELKYIETRNEFKKEISATFGVMPVYLGDVKASGGFNSEREQMVVTARAVEIGQGVFNDKLFPWLCKQLKITDYKFFLEKHEEADVMANIQIQQAKAKYALAMAKLGFDVDMDEHGEFTYKKVQPSVGGIGEERGIGQIPQDEKMAEMGDVGFDGKQETFMENGIVKGQAKLEDVKDATDKSDQGGNRRGRPRRST